MLRQVFCGAFALALISCSAFAQDPCIRYPAGSTVQEPEDLYSKDGVLTVDFTYQTSQDPSGKTYFCFVNADGVQSPTLHVHPGDTLVLTLTNLVPATAGKMPNMPGMDLSKAGEGGCGAANMTASSVNLHYHGTNTAPVCHQDEVIHTIINSGETFRYEVHFPTDEPPGLYWYHPHIHGLSTAAVQGGATGAIVVEGIENVNSEVAGLPQRVLVVRENPPAPPPPGTDDDEGATDLSVNYVLITTPVFTPAVITMKPSEKQFWRVVNSAAHTILNLTLTYDGVVQPIDLIALDGVPIGSQDGTGVGKSLRRTHVLVPPAGRAEFVMTGPSTQVADARLLTEAVTTGPIGDMDPTRSLLVIKTSDSDKSVSQLPVVPAVSAPPPAERFAGLDKATPTAKRKLFFSEDATNFYITVDGHKPHAYQMDDPPSIVTTQGAVEDWTIENRAPENHEFHMHQIHFLVMGRNGKPVPAPEQQYQDTVDVPYWGGTGPYPSVTLRMDFRGPVVGDFVYHCHILDHEDAGMMAIIRVMPQGQAAKASSTKTAKVDKPAKALR